MKDYKDYTGRCDSVVVLGKFDGVHIGHKKLFEIAKSTGLNVIAFTFLIKGSKTIISCVDRYNELIKAGADIVIEQEFTKEFASTSPEMFVSEVLVNKLHAKAIVCGTDFCFGKDRKGNVAFLKECADIYGYKLYVANKELFCEKEVSSTLIRQELSSGNISFVNGCLGYNYSVTGKVITGNKLGRKFMLPTANILLPEELVAPHFGVYATHVTVAGKTYRGLTNVGVKPSISDSERVGIETYIYDFSEDIYDCEATVEFLKYFRPEMRFNSVEELFAQISSDKVSVLEYFESGEVM